MAEAIELETTISKGDRLRLVFSLEVPWFKDAQVQKLAAAIDDDPRFRVVSFEVIADRVEFIVDVVKDPLPLVVLVGIILGAGSLVFLVVNFESAERLSRAVGETAEKFTPVAISIAVTVAAIVLAPVIKRVFA